MAGIHAYLDMVNASRGHLRQSPLRLLHIDDGYDPEKAKAAFRELAEVQWAFAYISHFGAPPMMDTLADIKRVGIPVVGFATSIGLLYVEQVYSYAQDSS